MGRRARSASLLAAVLMAGLAHAEEEVEPLDAEFLEFLGSFDIDDEAWTAFVTEAETQKGEESKKEPKDQPEGEERAKEKVSREEP
jgi:hypothetical protein